MQHLVGITMLLVLRTSRYVFVPTIAMMLACAFLFPEAMHSHASKKEPDPDLCMKEKISTRGRPNRIRAMASMNAVIQWINLAKKKHGESYALWHTAFETKIACEKIKDSDYHICFAAGKPCKSKKDKDEKNSKKTDKKQPL